MARNLVVMCLLRLFVREVRSQFSDFLDRSSICTLPRSYSEAVMNPTNLIARFFTILR
jgi:hypothetical protein